MAYRRYGAEVGASVTLPAGLTGELVWRGQTYTLASGAQELKLPARWVGCFRAAGDMRRSHCASVSGPVLTRPQGKLPFARSGGPEEAALCSPDHSPTGKSAGVEITCRVYKLTTFAGASIDGCPRGI